MTLLQTRLQPNYQLKQMLPNVPFICVMLSVATQPAVNMNIEVEPEKEREKQQTDFHSSEPARGTKIPCKFSPERISCGRVKIHIRTIILRSKPAGINTHSMGM